MEKLEKMVHVRLTDAQRAQLRTMAQRYDGSVSAIARRALRLGLMALECGERAAREAVRDVR